MHRRIFAASLLLSLGTFLQADPPPEKPPPPTFDGVRIVEKPGRFRVTLKITNTRTLESETVSFSQLNMAADREDIASSWAELTSGADDHYAAFGFEPLRKANFSYPDLETLYYRPDNLPTHRQLCGGFALAPLLGDTYVMPSPEAMKIVGRFGTKLRKNDAPREGDLVVFYKPVPEQPEVIQPEHYAVVESVGVTGPTIITKNGGERAYRGSLLRYVTSIPGKPLLPPVSRVSEGLTYEYFRMPWSELSCERQAKNPARYDCPEIDRVFRMGVQVVDAETYERLEQGRIQIHFQGQDEPLRSCETDPSGITVFQNVADGKLEVRASADGYRRGSIRFTLAFGEQVNVILPLQRGVEDAASMRQEFSDKLGQLERINVEWLQKQRQQQQRVSQEAVALLSKAFRINNELVEMIESVRRSGDVALADWMAQQHTEVMNRLSDLAVEIAKDAEGR